MNESNRSSPPDGGASAPPRCAALDRRSVAVAPYDAEEARALVAVAQSWRRDVYPRHTEVGAVTEKLRALLAGLLSAAENSAATLLDDSPVQRIFADVITDARRVVAAGPGPGLRSATNHARALADVVDRLLRDREGHRREKRDRQPMRRLLDLEANDFEWHDDRPDTGPSSTRSPRRPAV